MSAMDVLIKWWLGSNGLEGSTPRWTSAAIENTDAILAALDAAGYAVVPVEPTEAMRVAAVCTHPPEFVGDKPLYEKCWSAMVTAAKETP